MHLRITKPYVGLVTITLDDRRGITGMRKSVKGVEVSQLEATVAPLLKEWKDARDALYDLKKRRTA